jgi:hypothetical protein
MGEFLIKFGEDPAMIREFRKNPKQVMTNAGVSKKDQEIIMSGDSIVMSQAIRDCLGGDKKDTTVVVVVVVVVVA